MNVLQVVSVVGVLGISLSLPLLGTTSNKDDTESSKERHSTSERAENETDERASRAGWMQSEQKQSKTQETTQAATNVEANANANSIALQHCMARETGINQKVAGITASATLYEKKLTNIFEKIKTFRNSSLPNRHEVNPLILAAENIKKRQVDPLLAQMQSTPQIVCSNGVENVISSLVTTQNATNQLRDALVEYKNSIRAVIYTLKNSNSATQ